MRYWIGWSLLGMAAAVLGGVVVISIGSLKLLAVLTFSIVTTSLIGAGVYLITK